MGVRNLFTNVDDQFLVTRIDDVVIEFKDLKMDTVYRYDFTDRDNIPANKFTNCTTGESGRYADMIGGLAEEIQTFLDRLLSYIRDDFGNLKSYRFSFSYIEPTQVVRVGAATFGWLCVETPLHFALP